jgi:hypothetical protein
MANGVYNRGLYLVSQKDLDSTTLRLMLVSTGYVFDPDHARVSYTGANTSQSPAHFEISVGGYARQSLAALADFQDDVNDFAGLDATDVTFAALVAGQTVGGAVLYLYSSSGNSTGLATTGDSGQDLLSFYDVTDTPTNGGDITIQWASTSAGGVLKIGTTS